MAVGGCGGRCLNQDLRDLMIFGIRARTGGAVVGMGRGCGWLRWALSESGFAGFEDFRD